MPDLTSEVGTCADTKPLPPPRRRSLHARVDATIGEEELLSAMERRDKPWAEADQLNVRIGEIQDALISTAQALRSSPREALGGSAGGDIHLEMERR